MNFKTISFGVLKKIVGSDLKNLTPFIFETEVFGLKFF